MLAVLLLKLPLPSQNPQPSPSTLPRLWATPEPRSLNVCSLLGLRTLALDHLARDCAKEEAGQDLKVLAAGRTLLFEPLHDWISEFA